MKDIEIKIIDFSGDGVKPKGCLLDTETMPWKEPRKLCRRETKEEKQIVSHGL